MTAVAAQRASLRFVPFGAGQADGADFRSSRGAGLADKGRLAVGLRFARRGPVGRDLHPDFGAGQVVLHIGAAAFGFQLYAPLLGDPLLGISVALLMGDLALGQDLHQLVRQNHVLDVNAPALPVVGQNMVPRLPSHPLPQLRPITPGCDARRYVSANAIAGASGVSIQAKTRSGALGCARLRTRPN